MTQPRAVRVTVFCEDRGHQYFVGALIQRLAQELALGVDVDFRSAAGGHGRAVTEFNAYQQAMRKGQLVGTPDLLVVVIDGNEEGWQPRRQELRKNIDEALFPRSVVGCPDPYIERWCLVDLRALKQIGARPPARRGAYKKGARTIYKKELKDALEAGAIEIAIDEMEVAPDIVRNMNLEPGAIQEPSLDAFVKDLRRALQRIEV